MNLLNGSHFGISLELTWKTSLVCAHGAWCAHPAQTHTQKRKSKKKQRAPSILRPMIELCSEFAHLSRLDICARKIYKINSIVCIDHGGTECLAQTACVCVYLHEWWRKFQISDETDQLIAHTPVSRWENYEAIASWILHRGIHQKSEKSEPKPCVIWSNNILTIASLILLVIR